MTDINKQATVAEPMTELLNEETKPVAAAEPESTDEVELKLHEAVEKRKHDTVALEKYANDMVEQKRKANEEAKQYREKYESLQRQIEENDRQRKLSELNELEKKQLEIDEHANRIRQLEQTIQQKEAEKKQREFEFVADKLGAKDQEIVQFFLEKHISSLPEDEREYEKDNLNVETWMRGLKVSKPDLFKSVAPQAARKDNPEAPKASSGTPPQDPPKEDKVIKVKPISKSKQDKAEVEAMWQQIKSGAH